MASPELPGNVLRVADDLAGLESVVAVVLGGSRAIGAARADSDWDLGVYYRSSSGALDPDDVRDLGYPGHGADLGLGQPVVHRRPVGERHHRARVRSGCPVVLPCSHPVHDTRDVRGLVSHGS